MAVGALLGIFGFLVLMAAPFATLPLAQGEQIITISSYYGFAQLSRELFYVFTVTGYAVVLIAAAVLHAEVFVAFRWLIAHPALVTLLLIPILIAVGVRTFAGALGGEFYPFHEGEWLFPYNEHSPLIHGYMINEFPLVLAESLNIGVLQTIAFARAARLSLGLLSYALIPLIFLAVVRRQTSPATRSAFVVAACAVFVVLHCIGLPIGSADFGLLLVPVRNLPVLLILLCAIWITESDRPRVLPLLAFGAIGTVAFLFNITALYLWPGVLALLCLRAVLVDGGGTAARIALCALIGCVASAVIADFVTGGAVRGSLESAHIFSSVGRTTFGDQVAWLTRPGLGPRVQALMITIQAPLFLTSAGGFWLVQQLWSGPVLSAWVMKSSPALIMLGTTAISFILVTGAVGTAHPAPILIATVVAGCLLSYLQRRERISFPNTPSFVSVAFVGCFVLLAGHAVETAKALKIGLGELRATSPGEPVAGQIAELYASREVNCVASLTSEGGLFYRTGVASCFNQRFPIYDARVQAQLKMVRELRELQPAVVQVASASLDHHYPPQFHVPILYSYVMSTHVPDVLVGEHWFWRRSPGGRRREPAEALSDPLPTFAMPALPELIQLDVPLAVSIAREGEYVGLLLYATGAEWPSVAAVGRIGDGRLHAELRGSLEVIRGGAEVRLVRPGAPDLVIAVITP